MARAFAIDETSETSRSTSCATPLAVALSLMVGVVDDSGAVCAVRCGPGPNQSRRSSVCSGAVNGTTIWTTNQMATSCERRRDTIARQYKSGAAARSRCRRILRAVSRRRIQTKGKRRQ
jgi:hypothetical protein